MSRSFRRKPVAKYSTSDTNKPAKISWHRRLRRRVRQQLRQQPDTDTLPDGREFVNRFWFHEGVTKWIGGKPSKKDLRK